MDLPVFLYFHAKTGLIQRHTKTDSFIVSRQERIFGQLSIWLQDLNSDLSLKSSIGFLFCLDLSLSRSTDHQGLLIVICICYLIVSSPYTVRPTTLRHVEFSELDLYML